MGFIAIVGSGALGGASAQTLAERDRVSEVRLVDPSGRIAEGKALDIRQSASAQSQGFSTRVTAADALTAAAGADVIVIADDGSTSVEHAGESGLAMIRQLVAADATTPIVCAGAAQRTLIATAVRELHVSRRRILGSAPLALESAIRAMVGLSLNGSGVEVSLRLFGAPPADAVVAWDAATAFGQPLSALLPPHTIAALNARIPGLWPPGPYALGAAAARIAEGIVNGSRRQVCCFVTLDAGPLRTAVAAMPVQLGNEGIRRVLEPSLTRLERTRLETALDRS